MIAHYLASLAAFWPNCAWSWSWGMPDRVLDFCVETAAQMGLERQFLTTREVDEDILSAAIEAAEALGV
jgi:hypothetical protein